MPYFGNFPDVKQREKSRSLQNTTNLVLPQAPFLPEVLFLKYYTFVANNEGMI